MAGNGSRGGSGRTNGGAAPAAKRGVMQYQPSLSDKKLQKSISTTRRAMRYLAKEGVTPDDRTMGRQRDRLTGLIRQATSRTGALAGIRVSVASRAQAGARYRRRAGWTVERARDAVGGKFSYRNGFGPPARTTLGRRATTRGQGNLLTGGFSGIARSPRMNRVGAYAR